MIARTLISSLLLALSAMPLATPAAAASPPPPGGGGTTPPPDPAIVFADAGIKVMNADGTNVRALVTARRGEVMGGPAWSPDDSQIVFSARINNVMGIYTVPLAGGSPRLVTPLLDPRWTVRPDWSPVPAPDGQYKIVYDDTAVQGYRDLYIVNPDGSGRANLTATPVSYEVSPSWSPDGAHLLVDDTHYSDLIVLDAAVVNGALGVTGQTVVYGGMNAHPRWSRIAATAAVAVQVGSGYRVATLDLSNPLATPRLLSAVPAADERSPSLSPDGARVVFQRNGSGGGIFVINSDGTGEVRISSRGTDPNWRHRP